MATATPPQRTPLRVERFGKNARAPTALPYFPPFFPPLPPVTPLFSRLFPLFSGFLFSIFLPRPLILGAGGRRRRYHCYDPSCSTNRRPTLKGRADAHSQNAEGRSGSVSQYAKALPWPRAAR